MGNHPLSKHSAVLSFKDKKEYSFFQIFCGWEWSRTTGTSVFTRPLYQKPRRVTELPQPYLKNCYRDFKPFGVKNLVNLTSGIFLLTSRFLFKDKKTFSNRQIFFELGYRVSFITYRFLTHYKIKINFWYFQVFG